MKGLVLVEFISTLKDGEQIDRLGFQGLKIIQNPAKFKFTIDAFLLAGFIAPKITDQVIELGSGGGVLSLLIAGQKKVASVTGLEIQPELVEMANRSISINQLEDKIKMISGDLKSLPSSLKLNSFDYVISNPPFFPVGKGVVSENSALAIAKFEISCTLSDVVKAAVRLVKGNGRVTLIYPTERFAELMFILNQNHLVPRKICFIHPKPHLNSNLLLIETKPGIKNNLQVLPPIIISDENGDYTKTMELLFAGHNYSDIIRDNK